eukprot:CAMPEP_0170362602 /NCGR_PEP_ID=MMETSP0117_2-20130122/4418_1 /TAXON_ID=400756 /ORGANISM="Durinskia baltica, Strain CSIRO CS-38" /LENGTH=309 /DNA_ID=CAMNT_0010617027 /DNA_START=57 /DNA_END=983 /DNA_ORIENTATION=-
MGERKVINNYISPDFDPSLLPKFKRNKDKLQETRMMMPFSMQCNTCGEYMYRGKKFNSRTEICKGEDYMGIRKIRFYIKCSVCSAEITFKTDPKNSDYECESGASRNFEVWRETEEAKEQVAAEREEEDANDTMKALENRTLDSKIEMDVLDALDEIRAINQRHERVDTSAVLNALHKAGKKQEDNAAGLLENGLTAADEDLVKSIKFKTASKDQISVENINNSTSLGDLSSGFENKSKSAGADAAALLQKQLLQQKEQQKEQQKSKPVVILKKRKADLPAVAPAAIKIANTGPVGAEGASIKGSGDGA